MDLLTASAPRAAAGKNAKPAKNNYWNRDRANHQKTLTVLETVRVYLAPMAGSCPG